MNKIDYTVVLEPNNDERGYTVTVPALPGCVSLGDTVDEPLDNVKDAILLWISMARKSGEQIPEDWVFV
ncbi:MAG: type II toxin-antitoxin system HicB family antitoxin [Dehalococcoidia bacterium]|nr:type II toxin-antitoxin system HicB family antitoxin [Dehalococcoidia bacterium]